MEIAKKLMDQNRDRKMLLGKGERSCEQLPRRWQRRSWLAGPQIVGCGYRLDTGCVMSSTQQLLHPGTYPTPVRRLSCDVRRSFPGSSSTCRLLLVYAMALGNTVPSAMKMLDMGRCPYRSGDESSVEVAEMSNSGVSCSKG